MIREANLNDYEVLDNLLTKLIQDERINYDEFINPNFVVKNWYKKLIYKEDKLLIVYEENDNIVGYLYGYIIKEDNVYLVRHSKLDALYVLEEYRNKGIADKLINEFMKWSKSKNAKYCEVNVMHDNIIAKKLYKKNNFKESKEILRYEF